MLPNCPKLPVHYLACLKVGLVLVPMNYWYTPPEMDHTLWLSEALILVAAAEWKEDLERLMVLPTLGIVALWQATDNSGYLADLDSLLQEEGEGESPIG